MEIYILLLLTSFCCVTCELETLTDLTWDINEETIYWSTDQPFVFTKKIESYESGYWYASKEFCSGEHGGTHFDAPYHFFKNGWKVGDVPLSRLVAKGAVVDLRNKTQIHGGSTCLEVEDLKEWQRKYGSFEEGTVLLVKFGWSKYWANKTIYMGQNEMGSYNFPGVSGLAAKWLADSGKFYGVGLDTASVDLGRSTDFLAHRILTKNQMYILENVKLLTELPAKGFNLFVMPMKIKEGTGAPVRLLAVPRRIY